MSTTSAASSLGNARKRVHSSSPVVKSMHSVYSIPPSSLCSSSRHHASDVHSSGFIVADTIGNTGVHSLNACGAHGIDDVPPLPVTVTDMSAASASSSPSSTLFFPRTDEELAFTMDDTATHQAELDLMDIEATAALFAVDPAASSSSPFAPPSSNFFAPLSSAPPSSHTGGSFLPTSVAVTASALYCEMSTLPYGWWSTVLFTRLEAWISEVYAVRHPDSSPAGSDAHPLQRAVVGIALNNETEAIRRSRFVAAMKDGQTIARGAYNTLLSTVCSVPQHPHAINTYLSMLDGINLCSLLRWIRANAVLGKPPYALEGAECELQDAVVTVALEEETNAELQSLYKQACKDGHTFMRELMKVTKVIDVETKKEKEDSHDGSNRASERAARVRAKPSHTSPLLSLVSSPPSTIHPASSLSLLWALPRRSSSISALVGLPRSVLSKTVPRSIHHSTSSLPVPSVSFLTTSICISMVQLVRDLIALDSDAFFVHPNPPPAAYWNNISAKMDLMTISHRVTSASYVSIDSFVRDISLVFDNAMKIHESALPIHKKAKEMKMVFTSRCAEMFEMRESASADSSSLPSNDCSSSFFSFLSTSSHSPISSTAISSIHSTIRPVLTLTALCLVDSASEPRLRSTLVSRIGSAPVVSPSVRRNRPVILTFRAALIKIGVPLLMDHPWVVELYPEWARYRGFDDATKAAAYVCTICLGLASDALNLECAHLYCRRCIDVKIAKAKPRRAVCSDCDVS